jgi:hypothetical protein
MANGPTVTEWRGHSDPSLSSSVFSEPIMNVPPGSRIMSG